MPLGLALEPGRPGLRAAMPGSGRPGLGIVMLVASLDMDPAPVALGGVMLARLSSLAVLGVMVGCATAASTSVDDPRPTSQALDAAAPTVTAPTDPAGPDATAGPGVLGTDHVGLTVTDLEASRDLFVDVLGFRVRGRDEGYPAVFLTNDATTVTLWRATDPSHAIPFDRHRNVGLHHLALAVASFERLDALYERLREYEGVTIEFAPELAYGGPAKHMMFREPSGNRIELVHRPAR